MKKRGLALILAVLVIIALSACGGGLSNKNLQKMMLKSDSFYDLDTSTAKVIDEAETDKNSRLILFSAKTVDSGALAHGIAIYDKKEDALTPMEFAYPPMQYLNDEIALNRHQELNGKYFQKIAEYMAENKDFFSDEEGSADFLREITAKDTVLSTAASQKAIEDFAKADLGIEQEDEFCGIFEEGTANPLCYAALATESIYSWDWLPESQYLSFISNNPDQIEEAEAQYGPAYKDSQVWVAFDLLGNKKKVYKTKAQLYEDVVGEGANFEEETKESEGVLRFVTASDKKPFAYMENGVLMGADVEIAKKIAEELNMEIEISTANSSTAIKGTGNGSFDMAMAGFTAEVSQNNTTFTDNYYGNYVIILGNKNIDINQRICMALARLKDSGDINTIAEKYNLGKASEQKTENPPASESPQQPASQPADSGNAQISYRVRKSANDSSSQAGAFASLENAKKEANNRKAEGYKVYDIQGNLIYTP